MNTKLNRWKMTACGAFKVAKRGNLFQGRMESVLSFIKLITSSCWLFIVCSCLPFHKSSNLWNKLMTWLFGNGFCRTKAVFYNGTNILNHYLFFLKGLTHSLMFNGFKLIGKIWILVLWCYWCCYKINLVLYYTVCK